jgi:predicted RNA-binding protein with PIN domain
VRLAAERLGRDALPVGLRPYAAFNPKRLAGERPRRAVAAALGADQRLCEAVGESLDAELWAAAADTDGLRLSSVYTAAEAVAGLAARRRFADVATVAAGAVKQSARDDLAGEPPPQALARDRTGRAALSAARADRDAARRRADAAEQRWRSATADLQRLGEEVAALRAERDRLDSELEQQRRQARDRTARLRRRVQAAERQAATTAQRLHEATTRPDDPGLTPSPREPAGDGLGQRPPHQPALRAQRSQSQSAEVGDEAAARGRAAAVPRTVRAASPGRPCALPPGLRGDEPDAVHALLKVPGQTVVLDGYNVTLSPRGVGTAALADQRAWLTRLAAAAVARYGVRAVVVFDGDRDRSTAAAATRGVQVVFTAEDQTADERIVEIVSSLRPDQPVVVVSSDREVRDDCEALGANVIAAGAFLRAVA